jgi:hypothetical protein
MDTEAGLNRREAAGQVRAGALVAVGVRVEAVSPRGAGIEAVVDVDLVPACSGAADAAGCPRTTTAVMAHATASAADPTRFMCLTPVSAALPRDWPGRRR